VDVVAYEPDKNASKLGTLSQNKEVAVTGIVDNGSPIGTSESTNNGDLAGAGDSVDSGGGTGVTVPSTGDTEGDLVWIPTNGFTPCKICH
jgi:hypothetical protein